MDYLILQIRQYINHTLVTTTSADYLKSPIVCDFQILEIIKNRLFPGSLTHSLNKRR